MKKLLIILCGFICSLSNLYASETKDTLNISYVQSPFNLQLMVMRDQQLLEQEFSKIGVKVAWKVITSGSKQAQAMASGDLDIGGVMNSTSVLLANAAGNPIKIIAGVSRPTDTFAIVAAKNGVSSIKQLKGKKVAGPKGTVLHQTLVAALAKEGMNINDVNFIQMGIPQAFAALQTGEIDAALLAAGTIIAAEKSGAKVLTTATGLVVPKLIMTASDNMVKNHPDWVNMVIATHNKAWDFISKNTAKAIEIGAKMQDINLENAKTLYKWANFTQKFNQNDIKSMQQDMQFMIDNDMMQQAVDIPTIFLPQALE